MEIARNQQNITSSKPATELDQATAGDLLYGAAQIAEFLFGDPKQRRKVYYLIESCRLPVFRLGSICARRSTLIAWIAAQEKSGMSQNT